MLPAPSRLSVTQFLDYRTFLSAHVQEQKQRNPRWTFGAWAKRLGLKGTASITRVVHGSRDPGPELVDTLVRYFKFNDRDSEYFKDLVRLHKMKKDPRLAALLMEKIGKKYPNGAMKVLDEKTLHVISNWYVLTVREMLRLQNFTSDPESIARKILFEVTPKEVSHALKILVDVGLLELNSNGKYGIRDASLNTSDDVASEAIKCYHEQMLEFAKISLRETPVEQREISAQIICIKKENIYHAKELIRDFQDKFRKLLEVDQGDAVYQFQVQFFPLAAEWGLDEESSSPS